MNVSSVMRTGWSVSAKKIETRDGIPVCLFFCVDPCPGGWSFAEVLDPASGAWHQMLPVELVEKLAALLPHLPAADVARTFEQLGRDHREAARARRKPRRPR